MCWHFNKSHLLQRRTCGLSQIWSPSLELRTQHCLLPGAQIVKQRKKNVFCSGFLGSLHEPYLSSFSFSKRKTNTVFSRYLSICCFCFVHHLSQSYTLYIYTRLLKCSIHHRAKLCYTSQPSSNTIGTNPALAHSPPLFPFITGSAE